MNPWIQRSSMYIVAENHKFLFAICFLNSQENFSSSYFFLHLVKQYQSKNSLTKLEKEEPFAQNFQFYWRIRSETLKFLKFILKIIISRNVSRNEISSTRRIEAFTLAFSKAIRYTSAENVRILSSTVPTAKWKINFATLIPWKTFSFLSFYYRHVQWKHEEKKDSPFFEHTLHLLSCKKTRL